MKASKFGSVVKYVSVTMTVEQWREVYVNRQPELLEGGMQFIGNMLFHLAPPAITEGVYENYEPKEKLVT